MLSGSVYNPAIESATTVCVTLGKSLNFVLWFPQERVVVIIQVVIVWWVTQKGVFQAGSAAQKGVKGWGTARCGFLSTLSRSL